MALVYILKFIFSFAMGFVLWKLYAGKHEGDKLERSFRPVLFGYRIHIHHWIWCSAILIILLIFKVFNPYIIGLLCGSIFQGLLYRDRFVVVYKDKDFEKIYSKYKK